MKEIIPNIQPFIPETIISLESVSGGDISQAFRAKTNGDDVFIKINADTQAYDMFQQEALGLQTLLKASSDCKIPEVISVFQTAGFAGIALEYIPLSNGDSSSQEALGRALAQLHQSQSSKFGFEADNYIGKLPQSNTLNTNWSSFYVNERLAPQLTLSLNNNLLSTKEVPSKDTMIEVMDTYAFDVVPSLLHGDLWSGNYGFTITGQPVLYDPAVYYGHYEVDLAMTKLFGGFSPHFYDAYHEIIPLQEGYEFRQELYQLYYLLVHLNLFGHTYKSSVLQKMNLFFK